MPETTAAAVSCSSPRVRGLTALFRKQAGGVSGDRHSVDVYHWPPLFFQLAQYA